MADVRGKVDKKLIGELLGEIVSDVKSGKSRDTLRLGLMSVGSEHVVGADSGQNELVAGAFRAMKQDRSLEVVMIGPKKMELQNLAWIETPDCEADITTAMNTAIDEGRISGAVALHYPFPLGTATVGRIVTPARGRELLVASTTGATASDRVEGMVRNAICGIAVAKSLGINNPTLGVLNVDGATSVKRVLDKLANAGYEVAFGKSMRADGGSLLRGNDLLAGAVDLCVTDTLTGNILMKLFSSWNNGGTYETEGFGYGPSVGEGWNRLIAIISRASGAPVIANALRYTADAVRGKLTNLVQEEFALARKAGLNELLQPQQTPTATSDVTPPPSEPTDEEIHGVDVLSIDSATQTLWAGGVYAEASMGCTGPVVKVPGRKFELAKEILTAAGYL